MVVKLIKLFRRIELALRHFLVFVPADYFIRLREMLESVQAVTTNIMNNMKSIYGANNRMNVLPKRRRLLVQVGYSVSPTIFRRPIVVASPLPRHVVADSLLH
jgi:hypothetical protein